MDAGSRLSTTHDARTTLASASASASASAWVLAIGLGPWVPACAEPAADVVVAWVDGVADEAGNRQLRIYEAGERVHASIVPDIPGAGIELLQIGVDARGRGVAVSSIDSTAWSRRGSGGRVTLSPTELGRNEVAAPAFTFTRSGDGILRALEVDPAVPPVWMFAPLSGERGLRVHLVGPPTVATAGRRWELLHASDAPVLVWAEVADQARVDGRVLALAYPSDVGEGPRVDDLRPLGRGTMQGRGFVLGDLQHLPGCAMGPCPSPSGRTLYALAGGAGCDLVRWSWVAAASADAQTPSEDVPLACPTAALDPTLVAVLDDDLVVLDDGWRLHLVTLPQSGAPGEPTVASVPKPAGLVVPYLVDHGHVLVVSSQQGEVARVDAEGPRIVSGVQSTCLLRDGFAVSPSGAWVVQSCNGQAGSTSLGGQIQRISVLGAELYAGVPMRPIAIDDEGNALLYSIGADDDDGVPRGLSVLTGDGQLVRVDELEPYPGQLLLHGPDGQPVPGRFAAGGPG